MPDPIRILHRSTGVVLYESATATTLRGACEEAVRSGADLRGANLGGAKGLLDGPARLQIGGSRHWIIVRESGYITIGCHHQPLAWWREHYRALGRSERYTEAQIAEYAAHIEYCAAWMAAQGVLKEGV